MFLEALLWIFSTQPSVYNYIYTHKSNDHFYILRMNHQSISDRSKLTYPVVYWISSLDGLASTLNSDVQNLTCDFFPRYLPTTVFFYSVKKRMVLLLPSTHMLKPKTQVILEFSTSLTFQIHVLLDIPSNISSNRPTSPLLLPYRVQTTIIFHMD